jgi:hypothetical protein
MSGFYRHNGQPRQQHPEPSTNEDREDNAPSHSERERLALIIATVTRLAEYLAAGDSPRARTTPETQINRLAALCKLMRLPCAVETTVSRQAIEKHADDVRKLLAQLGREA